MSGLKDWGWRVRLITLLCPNWSQVSKIKGMSYRYLLFYKPYDVLTQFTAARQPSPLPTIGNVEDTMEPLSPQRSSPNTLSPKTLKDYISVPGVYPAGRLDRDSEGLLLLTNHGWLQHRLTNPAFCHPRTYWVQVEQVPSPAALESLSTGVSVRIKGRVYQTRPAHVRLLSTEPDLPPRDPPIRFRKTVPTAWLEVVLTEGRNRQVRRMTAAVGHPTLRLVRVAIAHLQLEGLEPGQWRELDAGMVAPFLNKRS
jgi:23S rRNA pseudouridine2457 synthase